MLENGKAALRAIAVSDGKTIGRAQARFSPLGGGSLVEQLVNAPMIFQLRYNGPADTFMASVWCRGIRPFRAVAIGADISGRLVDPTIRGSLRTQNARIESAVTGMVLQNVVTSGRFNGSRLLLDKLSGQTPGGGPSAALAMSISAAVHPLSISTSRPPERSCSIATISQRP